MELKKHLLLPFLAMSLAVSCSEKEGSENEGSDSWGDNIPEGNTEVTISADRKSVYLNPLSGWVIYVPLIDDVDRFWREYENFPSSEGTVNVFDYGNIIYLRGSWTDFNPEEGVYIWQDGIDETKYPLARSLRLFEEGAKERGLKLAFTLKCDSRDANAQCTPPFVKEKMDEKYGADAGGSLSSDGKTHVPGKGYFNFTLGSVGNERHYWSPYPDDPVFQEEYAKFINALAAEYDDPEKTAFISGLGMGKWGEYHTCVYSTGDESPKIPVFDWVTDTYINAFKYTPCFTNYHKMVGTIVGEGTGSPDSEGMLTSAIEKGFCMRHDAFGMRAETFGYATWEKKFIANWTYKVPVAGEGGWIVNQGGYDENGNPKNYLTQYDGPRELRIGEYEDMNSAYVNMMDLRYDATYTSGETWSWFNDAFDYVEKFVQEDCYRIYPDRVTIPSKMTNGKEYTIQHRWLNLGHAYCPTNIRPYDGRFKVAFAIMNTETGEIIGDNIFFDEQAHPHDWVSGRSSYDFTIKPENIPAGPYNLCVGIVDLALGNPDEGDYRIGIRIAAQGDYTEGGWLKLGKVAIVD